MARIVFDARMVTPRMHGISRYAFNLLLELCRRDADNHYTVLHDGPYLPEHVRMYDRVTTLDPGLRLYGVKELWALPRLLSSLGADLFYSPTYSAPVFAPCPHIQTVHDLTLLWRGIRNWRYLAYYDQVVSRAAHRAARVLTETQFVAEQLRRRYRLPASRIAVVPSGVTLGVGQIPCETRRPEVLCLVNEKPHKNAIGALRAMVQLRGRGNDCRLVLVGKLDERLGQQVRRQSWIDWHTFLPQEDLARAYARASVFLFPSYSEGFGYPPLEAMMAGLPVVSSSATCLPEVLGDAVLYAPPDAPDRLAAQMARILESPALARELVERGQAQVARYSWQEMGRSVLALIQQIV